MNLKEEKNMITILDVEHTVTTRDSKTHMDPFESSNKMVMLGVIANGKEYIYNMNDDRVSYHTEIQSILNHTKLLVCHNVVHDLMWLWESNFKYDGEVYDTMLGEYVLQRGVTSESVGLEACAKRHELITQKKDTLKEYFKKGLGVDDVPTTELAEYLSCDIQATKELYEHQMNRIKNDSKEGIFNVIKFTNRVALTLARIYQRGFSVDKDALEEVKQEFLQEKNKISEKLTSKIRNLMGDIPVNLNSPEQLSWVVFSRKPKDKAMWKNNFTPYMEKDEFKSKVKEHSSIVYKSVAKKCPVCYGYGKIRKTKKDGKPFAKESKCDKCSALGYLFLPTNEVAGLRFAPPTSKWVSNNGFSVSKDKLDIVQHIAKHNDMGDAVDFLEDLKRLSALETYLSSFVEGIQKHIKEDGLLHVKLLQHRTATGRFSGADPNMQNMPRGGTFPVKKVFVSRWEGGKIMEADFAQLEFRTAAFLSQDKTAMKEIENGFDVHSYTAKIITEGGQKISRQEAKAHTFAPLYGATGFGRTPAEATYYQQFTEKYKGIALWHTRLAKEAVTTGKISTPSGREFSFPEVKRLPNGKVTYFTQIKNFPVQSFATADIVPLILIEIDKRLDNLQSCVVNTVHDSIVIDVHPDEENQIINLIKETNKDMIDLINTNFNIILNVPLVLEAKIGNNWLDMQDVA
jgi:DNA polymerase I-like protein with 3'-5' exonuclease and polymerase domains